MERITNNKIFIITGWALFIMWLLMPAISENNKSASGYEYGILAVQDIPSVFKELATSSWPTIQLSGLGNIFALISILLITIKNKKALYILSLLSLLFLTNNVLYIINNKFGIFEIGYYTWLLSYLALGFGFASSGIKSNA